MPGNRDAEPAGAQPGRVAVQPRVSSDELREFRRTSEAQRVEQLEADTELMLRLSSEGFDGKTWQEVARALVEYGFTVMRAWVVTGQVFVKLQQKGRAVSSPTAGIPRSDALTMAEDTVADAIVDFRDRVLKRGYWDPSKGASLTTFFIGNCLMFQFPNVYRRWLKDRDLLMKADSIHSSTEREHPALAISTREDPATQLVARDQSQRAVRRILAPITDETNRAILALRADGFDIDEIAEALELEYSQVESRIYRARKRLGRGTT